MEHGWVALLTNGALIIFGIYWVYLSLRMSFAPHHVGRLLDDPAAECSCKEKETGRTSALIQVMLQDGTIIKARTSPCLFCLENVRKGDTVGVTRFGSSWIVQRSPGWLRWKH